MFELSPNLDLHVAGRLLRAETAWGDLAFSFSWPGGCNELSFTAATEYGTRVAGMLRSQPIDLRWGTATIWAGTTLEPEWSGSQVRVAAQGAFKEGADYTPLTVFDGAYLPTDNAAIAGALAVSRGLDWTLDASVPNASLGSTSVYANVAGLWDDHATQLGQRWAVDAQRRAYFAADPTDVSYHVRAGAVDLGIATDNYASHAVLLYNDATFGAVRTVAYPALGSAPSVYEQTYGHVEWMKDITDQAPMTAATALGIAQAVYERSKQTPGFTNGLELNPGEIVDRGWQPISPARVAAEAWGKVVRVHGVPDVALAAPYTDFVVGSTAYTAGSSSVTVNPVGLVSRDPESVTTEIIESLIKAGVLVGEAA